MNQSLWNKTYYFCCEWRMQQIPTLTFSMWYVNDNEELSGAKHFLSSNSQGRTSSKNSPGITKVFSIKVIHFSILVIFTNSFLLHFHWFISFLSTKLSNFVTHSSDGSCKSWIKNKIKIVYVCLPCINIT